MTDESRWRTNGIVILGEYRSTCSEICSIRFDYLKEANPGLKGNNVHYSTIMFLTLQTWGQVRNSDGKNYGIRF